MKDPCVLFYINDWLTSTAEMDADTRGWYLNLLLHNYDKKSLPNDIEKLAVLCNVKFSEYQRFEQVFEHVLKHKFEQDENNRLTNLRTNDILKSREIFKDKRSNAGKISYMMKYFAKNYPKQYKNKDLTNFIKDSFDYSIDLKNEQMIKQMFEHLFELYINENEIENKDKKEFEDKLFKNEILQKSFEEFLEMRKKIKKPMTDKAKILFKSKLEKLSNKNIDMAIQIVNQSILNCWQDIYELKQPNQKNNHQEVNRSSSNPEALKEFFNQQIIEINQLS